MDVEPKAVIPIYAHSFGTFLLTNGMVTSILLLFALVIILSMSYYDNNTDALLVSKANDLPISPTMGTIIVLIAVAVLAFLVLRKRM
jgi:heme/copper-type cytochrome/quinol oxidase subunit 2